MSLTTPLTQAVALLDSSDVAHGEWNFSLVEANSSRSRPTPLSQVAVVVGGGNVAQT